MRSGMDTLQLKQKYPKKLVIMYLNRIYDISNMAHPGGAFIIRETNWTEVSRYLTGTSGLEKDGSKSWIHSKDAYKLLEQYYIGDIEDLSQQSAKGPSNSILRNSSGDSAFSNNQMWVWTDTGDVSKTTKIFYFKNNDFKVKIDLKGVDWIGKHFQISNGPKTRIYTNCSSLSKESTAYRLKLYSHMFQQVTGE
jgi:hypothetical protein